MYNDQAWCERKVSEKRLKMNANKISITAICVLLGIAAMAGGDEFVSARYMRIDKQGPAQTITFRRVDASGPGEYEHPLDKYSQKGQILPERILDPWWEWDFGKTRQLSYVEIRADQREGHETDLLGARLIMMDENRRVVWHQLILDADGQISVDVSPRFSLREMLGRTLPETPMREGLVSAPEHSVNIRRKKAVERLFNAEAMARAVNAYAEKYPDLFRDRDRLLSRIAAAAKADDGGEAADDVSHDVFFRLPQMKEFSEILAIRRGGANGKGLPQNWQGNTSEPVAGYTNELVRVVVDPLKRIEAGGRVLYAANAFIGDVALDYEAEKVAFSTRKLNLPPEIANRITNRAAWRKLLGGAGYCVAEMRLDEPGRVVELTPTNRWDIDYYDPMYLPDGRMFLVGTVGYQGVPCVSGYAYVGNLLLRYEDGRLRRISYRTDVACICAGNMPTPPTTSAAS